MIILADVEVTIEPIHMFDYRHRPLNRIPLPQRPKWLSESVKFIREFDPLASRVYERSPLDKIGRYPIEDRGRSFERDRSIHDDDRDRRNCSRNKRDYERDNENHEKDYGDQINREHLRYGAGNEKKNKSNCYPDRAKKKMRLDNYGKNENENNENDLKHMEEKFNLKDDLEELSDEDMDWEVGEKSKLNNPIAETRNKSRSSSPILSNPPNPSNISDEIQVIEDIINRPGRFTRPPRIVIILRGPPGSGKTYLARLIKDKEVIFILRSFKVI